MNDASEPGTPSEPSPIMPAPEQTPELEAEVADLQKALLKSHGCPQASTAAWQQVDTRDPCWLHMANHEKQQLETALADLAGAGPKKMDSLLEKVAETRVKLLLDKANWMDRLNGLELLLTQRAAFYTELAKVANHRARRHRNWGEFDMAQQAAELRKCLRSRLKEVLATLKAYRLAQPTKPGCRSEAE